MTEKRDLAEAIRKKVQIELHAPAINVKTLWITKSAHDVSHDWLQVRQRQRQVAELEGKVNILAVPFSKGELDEKNVGSTDTTNMKKRKKEDELLSEIEELSTMAKEQKDTRSNPS